MIMFHDADIDEETTEKIFAFVEQEAGRDAPLSAAEEQQVLDLLVQSPEARSIADGFRDLDALLENEISKDLEEVTVPPALKTLILNYDGKAESEEDSTTTPEPEANVVAFDPPSSTPARPYFHLAAAATVTAVFMGSGFSAYLDHVHEQNQAYTQTELSLAHQQTAQVETSLSALQKSVAALTSENQDLQTLLDNQTREFMVTDASAEMTSQQIAELERRHEQRMGELTEALFRSQGELESTRMMLEGARRQRGSLASSLEANEKLVATLNSGFLGNLNQLLGVNVANGNLAKDLDRYRREASWLNQVAGYHRGYAGKEREVEVSAKEERASQALTKWFATVMDKDFSIPDLSAHGLTFVGGRLFFISGRPTAQIAYHDSEGRLTGFCFTEANENTDTQPSTSRDNDLNLVSWQKNGIDYVLVGWRDASMLELVASDLHQGYGGNI